MLDKGDGGEGTGCILKRVGIDLIEETFEQ